MKHQQKERLFLPIFFDSEAVDCKIYKYRDKAGHWHFTDSPVREDLEELQKSSAPAAVQDSGAREKFTLQAGDKKANVTYSTLQLEIPDSALDLLPIQKIQSMGATLYDDFKGSGRFHIPIPTVFRKTFAG